MLDVVTFKSTDKHFTPTTGSTSWTKTATTSMDLPEQPQNIIIGTILGIIAGILFVLTLFICLLVLSVMWFVRKFMKKDKRQNQTAGRPREGAGQIYISGTEDRAVSQHRVSIDTDTAVVMKTNAAYISTLRQTTTKDYAPCTRVIDQRASNDYDNDPTDRYDYVIII